ncbi:hypothetical protein PCL_09627 [Purpureocillium lilacinum]|uniref:Uncharacterized protein n=1 Tax=Purpureocillium lilacinum TaxID=33203 RepID=A0A2U3DQE2_PURLI|nr:hypothetical protein PCL_09627 [Purpureocillium lilacinum]
MAAAAVALNNTQWVPETEGEKQLKTALEHVLISSPSAVIVKAPDNKTNRFILQTQGYHDLYLYVVEGIKFIDSTESFEKQFTKSTFATVDKIDPSAYTLLRDTTVSIAKHCKEFNSKGLGRLTTSANGAIAYADHCIGLMKEKADISLYNAFQVLLDEKYVTARKDDAFEEAVESATLAVQTMQRSAKEKSEDAKAMVELLQKFYTQTDSDSKSVAKVKEDFLTGPKDPVTGQRKLKPDGKPQEPYNEVMNAEITRLQADIEKSIKRRDEENDKWPRAALALAAAMATAMGSHAGSDPFDLDNHIPLTFADRARAAQLRNGSPVVDRPIGVSPAPRRPARTPSSPLLRLSNSAATEGAQPAYASYRPSLEPILEPVSIVEGANRVAQEQTDAYNAKLAVFHAFCESFDQAAKQYTSGIEHTFANRFATSFLDFWRQSLSILPPATAPTYSSVAAGRSPRHPLAGHATPSVGTPPPAPQQTADTRLQGRPIPAPPKEDLRVFVRLDAEAPARNFESYAIRTHIAAKVGIDLHQIPAAFPVNSGWALRATDTATRDLIVQRQSEWAQDLGANTVESSRKWYTYVVSNCPRRLTDLQGNEADYDEAVKGEIACQTGQTASRHSSCLSSNPRRNPGGFSAPADSPDTSTNQLRLANATNAGTFTPGIAATAAHPANDAERRSTKTQTALPKRSAQIA